MTRRLPRRVVLLAATAGLVASSAGVTPFADAQTTEPEPTLTIDVVTDGAAGGPFAIVLQRAPDGAPIEATATTDEADTGVTAVGLPLSLPAASYQLGLDPERLPAEPSGGTWVWTELICDDEAVEIVPETGLAAIEVVADAPSTCEMTVTHALPGETPAINPTLAAERAAEAAQEPGDDTTPTTATPEEAVPTDPPTTDTTEPPATDPSTSEPPATDTTEAPATTATTDAPAAAAEPAPAPAVDDPPIVIQQINEGVLIRKAADRTAPGTDGIQPLGGATMAAYGSRNNAENDNNRLGECVTGTSGPGECEIALNVGSFGDNFFIREVEAPPGYFVIEEIATGRFETDCLTCYTGEVIGEAQPYIEEVRVANRQTAEVPPDQTSDDRQGWPGNFNRSFANARINPTPPPECGLDVAMVVDVSESINVDEMAQLKGALTDTTTALVGTPTNVGMYSFATVAPSPYADPNLPATSLADNADTVLDWIDALPDDTSTPSEDQLTNWDQGLYQIVQEGSSYDVVLLVTDGFPTAWGEQGTNARWFPGGPLFPSAPVVAPSATEQAVASANVLKGATTRMVGLAVGEPDEISAESLIPVTGNGPDDVISTNFDELAEELVEAATANCQGSVTIQKQTRASANDDFTPAGGWTFSTSTTDVTPTSGVTQPITGLSPTFDVEFEDPTTPRDVSFTETLQDGFELVPQDGANATCTTDGGATTLPVTNAGPVGFTVEVGPTDIVTCVVQNEQADQAELTLVKEVVNDDGGTAAPEAWTVVADGPTPLSGTTGTTDVTAVQVEPGTYTLSESGGATGYTASAWSCTDGTLAGDTLTIAQGDQATCTIVNDDQPAELTLVKEVENNFGGTAVPTDWDLSADGPTPISGVSGDPAVTDVPVDAGRYVLSESGGPTGYSQSAWACANGVGAPTQFALILEPGDDITCTIVNSDSPATLTLVKEVVNDNGGTAEATDWLLGATGPTILLGPTGSPLVTSRTVSAGTYNLSEIGPNGYEASDWTCEGGTQSGASVTLVVGDDVTCTIVNDDIAPQLTLIKQVENVYGGTAVATDWTLSADGPTPIEGVSGDEAVTAAEVEPGDYTLSEADGPDGYEASDWTCEGGTVDGDTVTVDLGADVTCTIVNSDLPAELTLVKEVVNDSGGAATATDWTLAADGPTPISGTTGDAAVTEVVVDPGDYTLSESGGPDGYTASDWSCEGGTLDEATVTLAPGDSATCTIVNDDDQAELTLVKEVVNDDGGTATETDWTLLASGPDGVIEGTSGDDAITAVPVTPGPYTLVEQDGPPGYEASDWECEGGSMPTVRVVDIALGDSVTCTIVNDDVPAQLTLTKTVVNDDGGTAAPTDWTLSADGPTPVEGPTGDPAVTAAAVEPGTYDLSEDGPAGYMASDWTCTGGTQDGTSITVALGESATCAIVNDDIPAQLTLVKEVVNDDGGAAEPTDWTLSADGPIPVSGVSGDPAVSEAIVDPGTYDLSEADGPAGYEASDWTCEGGTQPTGTSVTLELGDAAVCTITNDDIAPQLTLVKEVVNDDGGTAVPTDWTLSAAGPTPIEGATGGDAVTAAPVESGFYVLGESGPEGYVAQPWSCEGAVNLGRAVFLPPGASATCTIVNDDAAAGLTLVKEVINDDGGTSAATHWTLTATGETTTISGPTGDPAVTEVPVPAGDYVLTETGPAGYEASDWACEGAAGMDGDTVTVTVGESVVCTVVNDDVPPTLTLVKEVVNDDGGTAEPTDWTLTATGPTEGVTGPTGDDAITAVTVVAGDYDLSEADGPTGYTASEWTCEGGTLTGSTVTVAVGDDATCTIVNDDVPAQLTLVKTVTNDDGGTAVPTDWTLTADGPTPISGASGDDTVTAAPVAAGDYDLSEADGPDGYEASDWACEGGTLDGTTISLALGESATCTIDNDDIPAQLTLVKEVVNDDGGTAVPSDWALGAEGDVDSFTGNAGSPAVTEVPVAAGTYDMGEFGPAGYAASDWTCEGGTQDTPTSVTLALGESATCTIVNDDIPAELTLVKTVVNDDGGTAAPEDWTLAADGPTEGVSGPTGDATVTAVPVAPGEYVLSEADGPDGYTASDWTCTGGTLDGDTLTLALGESATCTIVNDDQPADLTLVKEIVNDNGGTAVATDWTLAAEGPTTGITGPTGDLAVTAVDVLPGEYVVSESVGPDGYTASDWTCEGGSLDGDTVTVANGDSVTCTIVNDDVPSELTLVKTVINDDGGTAVATDWTLQAIGRNNLTGRHGDSAITAVPVLPGDYLLIETGGPPGYTASDWTCEGGAIDGNVVTVDLGASVTCEIVNDDQPAELTLVKTVINDDGGTAAATDWTLAADGPTTGVTGPTGDPAVTAVPVSAGDYVLSEADGPDGYTASDWTCEGGTLDGDTVTVANGESATCTVVNDDDAAGLTLVKEVVNDDGGSALPTDWTLSAAGPTVGVTGPTGDPAVTEVPVTPGDYVLAEADGPPGYTASDWTCDGGTLDGGTVTVALGDAVTCTIVNDDLPPELTIAKTATPSGEVEPGGTVTYTVTVTNSGEVPYTDDRLASFDDDLTEVLDDAAYNDDAVADVGTVSYGAPTLSWSGPLAPGASATVTYSVTVNDPLTGDGELTNAVVGPPESNCLEGTEPDCTIVIPVRALEIVKTSEPADVEPGGTVTYTVTVTNTGQAAYTVLNLATFDDDLTEVLDDATFNDDAVADIGGVAYSAPILTWSGPLAPGEVATVTYSVTVNDPLTGDGTLTNGVVGPDESNCDAPTDPDCFTPTPVRSLQIVKTSEPAEVAPGGTVAYTVTVTNTGQVPYTDADPATFDDDLTAVLDDATFNDDAAADVGGVSYAEPVLSWSGALTPGQVATVTYSVTVNDPLTGDGVLTNGVVGPDESNCDEPTDPDCFTPTPVRSLEIVKTSDAPLAVNPGDTIAYTVEVTNTGQVPYTELSPATFTDDLSGVLDDATYNGDAAADIGTPTFADPTLSWSGPLAPGETATVTYSVTLNDPLTGDGAIENVVTGPDESNCAADDRSLEDCVTVSILREFTVVKDASVESASLGDVVSYTVTVTNTGEEPFPALFPASFDDDLSGVVDDATYNGDAAADIGTVTYAEPVLSWSGPLAPGESATLTYSVTVNDPLSGDGVMDNTVVTPSTANCPEGSEDPDCSAVVPIRVLTIVKTADPTGEVLPGGTVEYTVTVTNTGEAPYTEADPASFDDDLTEVLDDATFDDDAAADIGEATYAEPTLSWSGPLEPGESATITYSVTVNDPISGDGVLTNAVVGPPESNCLEGTEPDCTIVIPVRSLEIAKSSEPAEVEPGGTVAYTVTVTNTGQVPYTDALPASFDDDLTEVLDDAAYNDDAVADIGTTTYTEPTLSWTGPLAPGQTATVTYSVTVNDPLSGDGTLTNGVVGPPESNCDEPTDPDCFTPTPVRALEIVKTSDAPLRVMPGDTITYSVAVTNTGQVAYTDAAPATFSDDLSSVLDDTTFNDDAVADIGNATYAEPTLSWSGPLDPGETATVTYSVTVNDPPTGDGVIDNVVTGPEESTCAADDRSLADCVTVAIDREFAVVKEASVSEAFAGDVVTYTVTVTNISEQPFTALFPASFDDDLSAVLDDATFNGDAAADIGEVTYAEPTVSWSGPLAPGESATITYSVTVNDPLTGDGELVNTVTTPPTGNCPEGSDDPDCGTITPVIPEDWGDAPDSYATLDAEDGPSHGVRLVPVEPVAGAAGVTPSGLFTSAAGPDGSQGSGIVALLAQAAGDPLLAIGTGLTAEADGTPDPDAAADADDAFGANPEIQLPVGGTYTMSVPVVNETADGATLAGWIDANGNGTFEAAELATAAAGESGTVDLTWSVPGDAASSGSTYLRLRLYGGTVDDPLPTGFVDAGEVEDWEVVIVPAPEPPSPEPPSPEPPSPAPPDEPSGPAGFLPRTGAGIARAVALGFALILVGATATLRSRRRRALRAGAHLPE